MPPVTVGELQVILSGDTSRLDRDMDRIDNRAAKTEKVHTAAWQRTGVTAGEALRGGMLAAERDADKIGDRTGGKLARGINQGLVRNSPLIAAAVGGALIAGAPLVIAGAAAMFAGVGAAAAAQTVEVRSAWTKLGKDMRDGAVADSAVLVPVYVDMAEQIGDAFQDMRPQLREAFADSAPLIESTTDGVIALGQNAMPGLVRAIAAGQPVFDGLEDFLASTGTGVTGLLDAISGHSPAAGAAFASLGDIVGDLLPMVGELLGQGAELAADVLPAVAAATGVTLDVLQLLGPLLPGIVTGFVAFKAAQTAAGYLQTFAVQAQYATIAMTGSVTAGSRVGTALSGFGKALPGVAIAVGVVTSAMAQGEAQLDSWARAMLDGGAAARQASTEMQSVSEHFSGWQGIAAQFAIGGGMMTETLGDTEAMMAAVKERADALTAAMSPLQQAEQDVTTATNVLSEKLALNGAGSREAEGAARELEAAERERERQSGALEQAIHGVTSAMIAQADQAMAALDSGFAYRNSLDALEDAQAALNAAIAEQGAGSEAAQRAQLALEQQNYNTALSFGQQQADLSDLSEDSLEYKRIVQEQMLVELHRLQEAAGPEMKAAIQAQIDALEAGGVALGASTVKAGELTGRMKDLGLSVHEIPGSKGVVIDAPTEDQKKRLQDLGYTVTNIPGSKNVIVTADTGPAAAALAALVARNYTINVRATMPDLNGAASGSGRMGTYGAIGGIVHAYANGGFEPMRGGIAQVVPPNSFRLIGDRVRDDEAYIPINQDKRSLEILALTAKRMGGAFVPNGARGRSVVAGSAGTGSATVGGVTEKHYHLHASVKQTISLREFMALQREADALYG